MLRMLLSVLVGIGLAVLVSPAEASQWTPVAGFRALLDTAEAVVAVEILQIDNSFTAADGPLIFEVKVLAVPKGRVAVGQTLRVWEAAQMAGSYRIGERRLLLLKKQIPVESYHRKAAWWNIPIGLDVFVADAALKGVTLDALERWLHELIASARPVPAVDIGVGKRGDDVLEFNIVLTNPGDQVIQFNPSSVRVSFDLNQRHFIVPVDWDGHTGEDWMTLQQGEKIFGTISLNVRVPNDIETLPVMLGHMRLSFPMTRIWVGYLTREVPLDQDKPSNPL